MDQQTARRRFASDGAAQRRSDGAARRESGRDRQRPQALEPGWLSGNPHRWIGGRRVPRQQRVVPVAGRRVLRSVDTWTVFRVSFLFYVCVLLVFLIAGALLWMVASTFGVIHNLEKFIRKLFDLNSFHFQGWSILLGSTLGGMVLVLLGTGTNVLAALLYNLIGDVVGGVEFTVEDHSPTAAALATAATPPPAAPAPVDGPGPTAGPGPADGPVPEPAQVAAAPAAGAAPPVGDASAPERGVLWPSGISLEQFRSHSDGNPPKKIPWTPGSPSADPGEQPPGRW